ncbi:MAG: DUF4440 domain-containing protein [Pseudomonadales bacterium]
MRAIGLFLLLIAAASASHGATGGTEMEMQSVAGLRAADAAWARAAAAGDTDAILKFWADDATNYFPGMPPAKGKTAIEKLVMRNRSQADFRLSWEATDVMVAASGELGYTSGPFELRARSPSGELVTRTGHYVCVWRKDADGRWQCILESSVFDPDPL